MKKQTLRSLGNDKRGFSTVRLLVGGVLSLVFLVVIGFVFIEQLTDANLLTAGGDFDNSVGNLTANVSDGVDQVSDDIPTVFSIGAFVLIISVLIVAWLFFKRSGIMNEGGGLG